MPNVLNNLPGDFEHDQAVWEQFQALCAFGGRVTGSRGEAAAREWAVEQLAAIGLGRLSREPTFYEGWRCRESRLELPSGGALDAIPLLYSGDTPAVGLEIDVIDCGRGTPEDINAMGSRVKGRAVLVRHEYMFATDTVHRAKKLKAAMEAGAAAFLIASTAPDVGVITGSGLASRQTARIPALGISAEAAAQIMKSSPARIRIRVLTEAEMSAETETVVLDLPGNSAERVVLSAHIDGHPLGESALDNATGVAVALALARAAAPYVKALPRGLTVCLFSAEEWGLAGSRAWLNGLSEARLRQFVLNINLDTILGGSRLAALTSGFTGLAKFVVDAASTVGAELEVHTALMPNSDHANFAALGIPAVRLVSGFDEPASKVRWLLSRHDRRDLATPADFVEPMRVAWSILHAALTASPQRIASL